MLMTKSIKGKNLDPQEQSPGVLYQKYLFTSLKFWAKKALRRNPFEYFFRNVSNNLLEFVKTVSLQSNPTENIVIRNLMMLADEMSTVEGDNNTQDPQEKSPGPSSSSQYVGSTFEISEDGT